MTGAMMDFINFKRIDHKKKIKQIVIPWKKNRVNIKPFPPGFYEKLHDMTAIVIPVQAIPQKKQPDWFFLLYH
jgi:hypothetical protein